MAVSESMFVGIGMHVMTYATRVRSSREMLVETAADCSGGSSDAETLTAAIIAAGVLPEKAVRDAAHITVATVHGVEYLLTWNCRHLANAQVSRRVGRIGSEHGFVMPTICTPEELSGEVDDA